jgi:hypothetical protein
MLMADWTRWFRTGRVVDDSNEPEVALAGPVSGAAAESRGRRPRSASADAGRVRAALAAGRVAEPEGIPALVSAIESDYQFTLARRTLASLIESAAWSIEVDRDELERRAFAEDLLARFREALPAALAAIAFGRVAFAKRLGPADASGVRLLRSLDPLPFERTELRLDEEGRFAGVRLDTGTRWLDLGPSEVWWFALDPTPAEPHGRSRYLGAPLAVWRQREELRRNRDVFLRKLALGHGVAKAPSDYPAPAGVGAGSALDRADPLDDLRRGLESLRSGGTLVLPSETDARGNPLFSYEPPRMQPDGTPLENEGRRLDAAVLRAMGIPERAVIQEDSAGSYALAEVHWRVLAATVDGIAHQLLASFNRHVIEPTLALNWPEPDRPAIRLTVRRLREDARPPALELVRSLLAAPESNALFRDARIDVAALLDLAGIPRLRT